MGRGGPTYDLHELQRLVGQGRISSSFTGSAKTGAALIGFGDDDIEEAVLRLTSANFYKSMEAERVQGLWQDVYHLEYRGVWLYIKLQLSGDGRATVVQFKVK
jgi:motility quorum-sensing regulator/GCU-specific mRNA interferase toxin